MAAITLRNAHRQSQRALFRLILQVNAEFHRVVWPVQEWLTTQVRQAADNEGFVIEAKAMGLSLQLGERWKRALDQWGKVFDRSLVQAGSIPFGVLWTQHNAYMPRVQMQESLSQAEQDAMIRLWSQRRDEALAAARQRVYSDRLNLSQRIWRLENGGLNDLRALLSSAFVERTNAADLARRIEGQLGADRDLPRWTEDRLYRMDARQRAQSTDGLLRDPAQRREGISYNALRLARTELQYAHHAVATEIARHAPWVLKRNVVLSPTHPKVDICDELVGQNPHPKDAELLPAHPNCVTPGQLVSTDRGDIAIEDICTDDKVLTHRGAYQRVIEVMSRQCSETVYEFKTDRGCFELTGEHPVLLRRGWTEAKFLQPGDQVLYARCGVCADAGGWISDYVPADGLQPSISSSVAPILAAEAMPAHAVTFNSDVDVYQCEVDEVPTHLVFTNIDDSSLVESGHHSDFGRRRISQTHLSGFQQHGHQSGIAGTLGFGNLLAYSIGFGVVDCARVIQFTDSMTHFGASGESPFPVVMSPRAFDCLAHCAHGDTVLGEHFTQDTEGNPVAAIDFRGSELLVDVDVLQEFKDWPVEFFFDSSGVVLRSGDAMLGEMGTRKVFGPQSADWAGVHNNLLLLLPEYGWGAESGNSIVGGVATPSQALFDYITIEDVRQREYSGPVYNMEVEGDHSYTVNGAVVHNCLCRYEDVVMDPSAFVEQARAWMRGENEFLDDYAGWLGTRNVAERWPAMRIADTLDFWLNTDSAGAAAGRLR